VRFPLGDIYEEALAGVGGVIEVHDLHIWTITSGFESLSVHARIGERGRSEILQEMRQVVRDRFAIEHSTVQLEEDDDYVDRDCLTVHSAER